MFHPIEGPGGVHVTVRTFLDVFLHLPIAVGLSILLWSYDARCLPHCIWLQWCDGYPTAGTNQCGLVPVHFCAKTAI